MIRLDPVSSRFARWFLIRLVAVTCAAVLVASSGPRPGTEFLACLQLLSLYASALAGTCAVLGRQIGPSTTLNFLDETLTFVALATFARILGRWLGS